MFVFLGWPGHSQVFYKPALSRAPPCGHAAHHYRTSESFTQCGEPAALYTGGPMELRAWWPCGVTSTLNTVTLAYWCCGGYVTVYSYVRNLYSSGCSLFQPLGSFNSSENHFSSKLHRMKRKGKVRTGQAYRYRKIPPSHLSSLNHHGIMLLVLKSSVILTPRSG